MHEHATLGKQNSDDEDEGAFDNANTKEGTAAQLRAKRTKEAFYTHRLRERVRVFPVVPSTRQPPSV